MINKVVNSIKKDGIIDTSKKIKNYIFYKFKTRDSNKNKKLINNIIDINKFDTVIIFENNFGWNKIMRQRPQQIASNFPKNTLIFYHSHESIDYPKKNRISKLKDNLVLIDLGYYRDDLLEILYNHNNKYIMVYSTDYIPYERIKFYEDCGYNIVYDYVDDVNADLSGELHNTLLERHKKILKNNSFVICTADKLYKNINKKTAFSTLITNGVEYEHFQFKKYEIPKDLKLVKNKYSKIICYYGALASWFDYDLIKKIALDKECAVILLGVDYDQTLEKSLVLECENIFYLGKKDYSVLPMYGCNSDVFIIPFLINDITKATSPVKIFEYMAMEKPIVTTALPECKKYKSVLYSNNHEEFLSNLNKAFTLVDNQEYLNTLKKEALENTWDSKAKSLIDFINSSKNSLLEYQINDILENSNYQRIVVWRSPFGWNVPLFQRPQHIAKQLSEKNCLVLYEVTKKTDAVQTYRKIASNLYLINFEHYQFSTILINKLENINKPKYIQIYSTNWIMSVEEEKNYISKGFKILYEYIDDISPELAGTEEIPQTIIDKYNYAINDKKVLIVTTAQALYEDILNKRGKKNLVLSCNGVDYNFFQKIEKNYKYEKKFLNIINNGKKNLCYYGALASWFDYDLIKKINAIGKYNIILIGIKYDNSFDNSNINKLKNVYFIGPKDYKILKNYASMMDILMIPFVINSITKATSPLKLFEYMALHKPIVTTDMDECRKYKSVLIGHTHDEFIEQLNKAIPLKNDKKYYKLLDKEAKENDWNAKADLIVKLLEDNERTDNNE